MTLDSSPPAPFDDASAAGIADSYTFVVDPDGTCVLNPRVPHTVGTKPWEWCVTEDRPACREAFVQACMFRKPKQEVQVRVEFEGRIIRLMLRLFPLGTGQVLCLFQRLFEGQITNRERHVLALAAGGARAEEIGRVLGISHSTARDHIANLKRKLNILHPEGFRLAAHHFGIHDHDPSLDEPVASDSGPESTE